MVTSRTRLLTYQASFLSSPATVTCSAPRNGSRLPGLLPFLEEGGKGTTRASFGNQEPPRKPPIPPVDFFDRYGHGDEEANSVFKKVVEDYLDQTVPVEHIVKGRIRSDKRVEGKRAFPAQSEIAANVSSGDWYLGKHGKTAFPPQFSDEALVNFLGDGRLGAVAELLASPDAVQSKRIPNAKFTFFVDKTLTYSEGKTIQLQAVVRLGDEGFGIETVYPIQGHGVSRVTQTGQIEKLDWEEE